MFEDWETFEIIAVLIVCTLSIISLTLNVLTMMNMHKIMLILGS